MIPAPNCYSNCPNPVGIYVQNKKVVGCPSTHPNSFPPPCAPNPPNLPGLTSLFVGNMQNGYNNFGCPFLYNRRTALNNKLVQLQTAGTNPYWQILLTNRVNYIDGLINQYCLMN